MKVASPCEQCIVSSMCLKPCEKLYCYIEEFMKDTPVSIHAITKMMYYLRWSLVGEACDRLVLNFERDTEKTRYFETFIEEDAMVHVEIDKGKIKKWPAR